MPALQPISPRLPAEPTRSFPFRLISKVGEGAMGEVLLAEDLDLHRQVAIKVIKLGSLDEGHEPLQRFLQEARAAAAISHPNVPIIYRVGVEGDTPYIAMEWIDGASLETLLEDGSVFPYDVAVRVGIDLLAAIEAAHAAGIVHRDIKPGNVMLTRDGHLKVTDFGIARMQGPAALARTRSGAFVGTPLYAAPEQLAGQVVDCRSDLYSVGCVLYELTTGRLPYEGSTLFQLATAMAEREPPAPSSLDARLPATFDAVLRRALAANIEHRFASAGEMRAALQRLLEAPERAPAMTAPSRPRVSRPRGPTLALGGATPVDLIAELVASWPATPLGPQQVTVVLERIAERPLHAPPFAGAVAVGPSWLLISDGLIYAAFDPRTGLFGDALLETLPAIADITLRPLPSHLDPSVVPLLASLLLPCTPRLAGLESTYTDLVGVADRLADQGFSGVLRLVHGAAPGFVLFHRGARVLDLFGAGWPTDRPWEEWIRRAHVHASVEDLHYAFPSTTYRRQLRDIALEVVRAHPLADTLRTDTVAEARRLELRPTADASTQLQRGNTVVHALVTHSPAYRLARWFLTDVALQFEQFGRAARWRRLLEPLRAVTSVRLYHTLGAATFDVATFGPQGVAHVVDQVALGSVAAVEAFLERARLAKRSHGELAAAVLIAPRFEEAALASYLAALDAERSLLRLDALRHREGYLRVGPDGLHVLLVEDDGVRRRPLMPQ